MRSPRTGPSTTRCGSPGVDEAIDRNEPTVAGLERNTIHMSTHQVAEELSLPLLQRARRRGGREAEHKEPGRHRPPRRVETARHRRPEACQRQPGSRTRSSSRRSARGRGGLLPLPAGLLCNVAQRLRRTRLRTCLRRCLSGKPGPSGKDVPPKRPWPSKKRGPSFTILFLGFGGPTGLRPMPKLTTLLNGLTQPGLLTEPTCVSLWPQELALPGPAEVRPRWRVHAGVTPRHRNVRRAASEHLQSERQ